MTEIQLFKIHSEKCITFCLHDRALEKTIKKRSKEFKGEV